MPFKTVIRPKEAEKQVSGHKSTADTRISGTGEYVPDAPVASDSNWQFAVTSHLNSLSPDQARDFKAPASLQECLDILARTSTRTSRFSNLLQLFRPALEPLQRFEGALDVIVQVNSGIASPIWGPLKAAISIANDHFKTLESLAMIVYKILSSIERYSNYEKLFAEDRGVQQAIGDLYSDLIDFCARIVRFHSKHFRSVFVTFDHEFGLVAELISFHSSQVDLAANAAHMVRTKEAQEASLSMQETQERTNVLHTLSPIPVEDDVFKYSTAAGPGSCDFVLRSEWLPELIHSGKYTSFCLLGPPGFGKTTLSAFLTQHLTSVTSCPLLCFFCKAEDPDRSPVRAALRTILSQLCLQDKGALEAIKSIYRQQSQLRVDSMWSLSHMLRTASEKANANAILIVIDALDECENACLLIKTINRSFGTKLRLLCTSRDLGVLPGDEDVGIHSLFTTIIRLGLNETASAVTQYIHTRVSKTPLLKNAPTQSTLVNSLIATADGLWLAARLLMDEVVRATSLASVARILAAGPTGLTRLYDDILLNREAHLTADEIRLAGQLLLWLDIHDYMNPRLAVDDEVLSMSTASMVLQFANDAEPLADPAGLVTRICCPLITIDVAPFTSTLEFVHLSAYHHVQNSGVREPASLPQILRPQRLRHLHRASASIWYLSETAEFSDSLSSLLHTVNATSETSTTGPFSSRPPRYFDFAYGLWSFLKQPDLPSGLDASEREIAGDLLSAVTAFLTSGKCLTWIRYALIMNATGRWIPILAGNAIDAIVAARESSRYKDLEAWREFNDTRKYFFENYLAILYESLYWDEGMQGEIEREWRGKVRDAAIPVRYQSDDPGMRDAPLDVIEKEARYWQERVRREMEGDDG